MKFYQTKEFRKENRKWYKKLKREGFKDIELGEDSLVRFSFHLTEAYQTGTYDYYVRAVEFLNTYVFETDLDRYIWSLHSEGLSCREISSQLRSRTQITVPGIDKKIYSKLKPSSVHSRIKNLESNMLKKVG